MCGVKLKSVQCANDLGVKIVTNLKFPQQCNTFVNKVNRMLGFTERNVSFRYKGIIVPLYNSLVISHLEYGV